MVIDLIVKVVVLCFWVVVLIVLLLIGIFCLLVISVSYFEVVYVFGLDNGVFWLVLSNSVDFWDDFGVVMFKLVIFGGMVVLVVLYVGFNVEFIIEGILVVIMCVVVNVLLLVLMFNFVLLVMMF